MKIYMVIVFFDRTTEKQIYTTEEQAKQVALNWAKHTKRYVEVIEMEPYEGRYLNSRTCGMYDKTSV